MDQIKIGKFIADRRKAQGLTQKQLADQLNVTDKTISKWETGMRLPDASMLLNLGAALKVDINELLAGEKFSSQEFSQEYIQTSERNILGLVRKLDDLEPRGRSKTIGMAAGAFLTGMALLYLFVFSLPGGRVMDLLDFPTLCYLLGVKFMIISISGWFHDYLNAWKACVPPKRLSMEEAKRAIQAVQYAGTLTLTLGCLISFLGLFSILNYMRDTSVLWPSLAQSVLPFLYGALEKTVYVILEFRMKRMS